MNFDKLHALGSLYFKISQESLNNILDCPICLNQISYPTLTPCGHSFCANCIATYFATSVKCPLCRAELTPPFTCRNKPLEKLLEYINSAPRLAGPKNRLCANPFEKNPIKVSTKFEIGRKKKEKAEDEDLLKGIVLSKQDGPEPMMDIVTMAQYKGE